MKVASTTLSFVSGGITRGGEESEEEEKGSVPKEEDEEVVSEDRKGVRRPPSSAYGFHRRTLDSSEEENNGDGIGDNDSDRGGALPTAFGEKKTRKPTTKRPRSQKAEQEKVVDDNFHDFTAPGSGSVGADLLAMMGYTGEA